MRRTQRPNTSPTPRGLLAAVDALAWLGRIVSERGSGIIDLNVPIQQQLEPGPNDLPEPYENQQANHQNQGA